LISDIREIPSIDPKISCVGEHILLAHVFARGWESEKLWWESEKLLPECYLRDSEIFLAGLDRFGQCKLQMINFPIQTNSFHERHEEKRPSFGCH
jgi:hypothetical protein